MADKRSKPGQRGKKKGTTTKSASGKTAHGEGANSPEAAVDATVPRGNETAAEPAGQQPENNSPEAALTQAQSEEPIAAAAPEQTDGGKQGNETADEEDLIQERRVSKQHHVSSILNALLEEEIAEDPNAGMSSRFRYPVYVDALLGLGLLVAVAGFTIGLFKMYVTHEAQQHIMQGDYTTAITVLEHTPMPPVFTMDGANPDEALAQALYLDALQKFDAGANNDAWSELQKIRPGSKYFDQSQRLLSENFVPSDTILQCGVTTGDDAPVQARAQQ
jgi:hypothetical protein